MNVSPTTGERPLYFLHIPKTAGTTFTRILDQPFQAEEICPAQLWRDFLKLTSVNLSAYRLYRGHFYYYFVDHLLIQPMMLTFLRDPIQRSISHYEHIIREPGHYLYAKSLELGSLRAFLLDDATRPMIVDFQTRSIGMDLDPVQIASRLTEDDLEGLRLEQILESTLPTEPSQSLLNRAKNRLAEIEFVGITERFDESVELLRKTLTANELTAVEPQNLSSNPIARTSIDAETLELLTASLQLDLELYKFGTDLFQARLREAGLAA